MNWVDELVDFVREQPQISAVRIDLTNHTMSVATIGRVDLADFQARLAQTVANVEAQLAENAKLRVPAGYAVKQEGGATVLGRETCVTAEKLWLWREMEWTEIKAEPTHADQEWSLLATLAAICGVAGMGGWLAGHFAPDLPWLARSLYVIGLIAGGWDAAVDSWDNLKKREIDIHFLMLAVAVGAMFIGAWGEAVLLLFLFSASGAMEEYALDRTQREVSSLLRSAPKHALIVEADGREHEAAVEALQVGQRVRVRPGGAFAADGLIVEGKSASDESNLTGEAAPVEKGVGDQVFSGTLNLWGAVDYTVVRPPSEGTLQKIIRLIQTAQKLKAPSERFTDKFGT